MNGQAPVEEHFTTEEKAAFPYASSSTAYASASETTIGAAAMYKAYAQDAESHGRAHEVNHEEDESAMPSFDPEKMQAEIRARHAAKRAAVDAEKIQESRKAQKEAEQVRPRLI